jgi:hypothetical protein
LLHRADRNPNPFRQIVTFHRTHNDVVFKHFPEDVDAVSNLHENEIRCTRHEWKIHRPELILQIGATFV